MDKTKDILILEAAINQFKSKGFAAVRIADIAKEAGIGKGTVYEYFSSKEELLLKACSYFCSTVDAGLESNVLNNPSLDNSVKFVYTIVETILTKLLVTNTDEKKLFQELSVISNTHPQLREAARNEFKEKLTMWRGMALRDYQMGLESGHFRHIDKPEDVAEFIVATVDGLIWQMQWQTEDMLKDQATRMARVYCQLIMKEPHRLEEYLK